MNTKIARVFTAYDFSAFKLNIEELQEGGGSFTTTDNFIDSQYKYFIGDVSGGWRVNRYDVSNTKTTSMGVVNKPSDLAECQALAYT